MQSLVPIGASLLHCLTVSIVKPLSLIPGGTVVLRDFLTPFSVLFPCEPHHFKVAASVASRKCGVGGYHAMPNSKHALEETKTKAKIHQKKKKKKKKKQFSLNWFPESAAAGGGAGGGGGGRGRGRGGGGGGGGGRRL